MPVMQKFVFPMRETMPFFVSSLRVVDDWKRIYAKRADAITQAELEANSKYVKSPFARSMKVEDLLRFVDDTVLDINFMVQLPSIEKCLDKWWRLYARGKQTIDHDTLRSVYYDLAVVLVEAKTETIHKNSVSIIMRSSWTKWSAKEPPLSKREFFRLLFILAHLMTSTDRLGDYVVFFHDTMSKISRNYRQKQVRAEQHSRGPRIRRKSTLEEIFKNGNPLSPKLVSERDRASPATLSLSSASSNQVLNVQMNRIPIQTEGLGGELVGQMLFGLISRFALVHGTANLSEDEDQAGDCFVELLERNSRYQRVVVDPLLHDRKFQEKFRHPGGGMNSSTTSMNDMQVALNPISNKYCPPMLASRLRTKASQAGPNQLSSTAEAFGGQVRGQATTPSYQTLSSSLTAVPPVDKRQHIFKGTPAVNEQRMHSSKSTPAITRKNNARKFDVVLGTSAPNDIVLTSREEELMRRNLSRVTLQPRVDRNKAGGKERMKNRGHFVDEHSQNRKEAEKKDIYLAIST